MRILRALLLLMPRDDLPNRQRAGGRYPAACHQHVAGALVEVHHRQPARHRCAGPHSSRALIARVVGGAAARTRHDVDRARDAFDRQHQRYLQRLRARLTAEGGVGGEGPVIEQETMGQQPGHVCRADTQHEPGGLGIEAGDLASDELRHVRKRTNAGCRRPRSRATPAT